MWALEKGGLTFSKIKVLHPVLGELKGEEALRKFFGTMIKGLSIRQAHDMRVKLLQDSIADLNHTLRKF